MNPQGQGPYNSVAGINFSAQQHITDFERLVSEVSSLNQRLNDTGVGTSAGAGKATGINLSALRTQVSEAEAMLARIHSVHDSIRRETAAMQRSLDEMRRVMSTATNQGVGTARSGGGAGTVYGGSYAHPLYQSTHPDRQKVQAGFQKDLDSLKTNFDRIIKTTVDQAVGRSVNDWLTKNQGNLRDSSGALITTDKRPGSLWAEAVEMVRRAVAQQFGAGNSQEFASKLNQATRAQVEAAVTRAIEESARRFSNLQRVDEQQVVGSAPRYVEASMLRGMWDQQIASRTNPRLNLDTSSKGAGYATEFEQQLRRAGVDPQAFRTFMSATGYSGGAGHKNPLTEAPVRQAILDMIAKHYRTSGRADLAELRNLLATVPPSGARALDANGETIPYMPITRSDSGWTTQRMMTRYGRVSTGGSGFGSTAEPDFMAPVAIFGRSPQDIRGYLQTLLQWQGTSHGISAMMNLYTGNLGSRPGQPISMGGQSYAASSFTPQGLNNQLRLTATEREQVGRVLADLIRRRGAAAPGSDSRRALAAELGDMLRMLSVAGAPMYGQDTLQFATGGARASVAKGAIGQFIASAGAELGTIIESLQQGSLPIIGYEGGQFPMRQVQRVMSRLGPGVQTRPDSFVRPLQALVSQNIRSFREFHSGAGREWFNALSKGSGMGEFWKQDSSGGRSGKRSTPLDAWRFYSSLPTSEEALALAAANYSGSDTAFVADVAKAFEKAAPGFFDEKKGKGTVGINEEQMKALSGHFIEFRRKVAAEFRANPTGAAMTNARSHFSSLMESLGGLFPGKEGPSNWGSGGAYVNQAMRLWGERLGVPMGEGGLGGGVLTPLAPEFLTPSSLGVLASGRMTSGMPKLSGMANASSMMGLYNRDPYYAALFGGVSKANHRGYGLLRLHQVASGMKYGDTNLIQAITAAKGDPAKLEAIANFFRTQAANVPFFETGGMSQGELTKMLPGLSQEQTGNLSRRGLLEAFGGNLTKYLGALGVGGGVTNAAAQHLSQLSGMPLQDVMKDEMGALTKAYGLSSAKQFITLDDFISQWADATGRRYRPGGAGMQELHAMSAGLHSAKATGELPPWVVDDASVLAQRHGAWPAGQITGEGGSLMNAINEHYPGEFSSGAGVGIGSVPGTVGIGSGGAFTLDALIGPINHLSQAIASLSQQIGTLTERGGSAATPQVERGSVQSVGIAPPTQTGGGGSGGGGGQTPPPDGRVRPIAPMGGGNNGGGNGGSGDNPPPPEDGDFKQRVWAYEESFRLQRELQKQFDAQAVGAFPKLGSEDVSSARRQYAQSVGYGRFGRQYQVGSEEASIGLEFRPDTEGNLQRVIRGNANAANMEQARAQAEVYAKELFSNYHPSRPGMTADEIRAERAGHALDYGFLGQSVASGKVGHGLASTAVDYIATGSGVQVVPRTPSGMMPVNRTDLPGVLRALEAAENEKMREKAREKLGANASEADIARDMRRAQLERVGENIRPINVVDSYGNMNRRMLRWGISADPNGRVSPHLQDVAPEGKVFRSFDEVATHARNLSAVFDELARDARGAGNAMTDEGAFYGEVGREKMRVAGQEVGVRFLRTAGGEVIASPEMGRSIQALPTPQAHAEVQNLLRMRAQEIEKSLDALSQVPGIGNLRSMGRVYDKVPVQWTSPGGHTLLEQQYSMTQTARGVKAIPEQGQLGFARVGGDITNAIEKVGLWAVATGAVYNFMAAVRGAYSLMTKFEEELATSRVLQPGYSDLGRVRKEFIGIANDYGQSLTNVTQAAHLWERQYKNVYQVLELTRESIKLSKVDNIDLAQANKYLEATINEMGFAASDVGRIVDSWTNVTNNAQVTMEDLAEGVARAGASAKMAGVDFDTLNGLIAGGVRATGAAGSEIGNMLKTVFAKMYTTDAARELNQIGVATHEVVNGVRELRPAQEILGDLASKWGTLTRAQQESIALGMAGGVRQVNRLSAVLGDYRTVLDAAARSSEGFGAANREVGIRMDTLAGQFAKLKANVQGVMSSSFFEGGGLNIARSGVSVAQNVVGAVSAAPPMAQGVLVNSLYGIAGVTGLNMMSRIFGGEAALNMGHLRMLANAGRAVGPVGAVETGVGGVINAGAKAVGAAGSAVSGWLGRNSFGRALQEGYRLTARSPIVAAEAAEAVAARGAVEGFTSSLLGGTSIIGGFIGHIKNMSRVMAIVISAVGLLTGVGVAAHYLKTTPEEREIERVQNRQIRLRPLYEARERVDQINQDERKFGALGIAQVIERDELQRRIQELGYKFGVGDGSGVVGLDSASKQAALNAYAGAIGDMSRGRGTERLSALGATVRGLTTWVPANEGGMTGIRQSLDLRDMAVTIGGQKAGADPKLQNQLMAGHMGEATREVAMRLGIAAPQLRQDASVFEIFESLSPNRYVVEGDSALGAFGQAAQSGKDAMLYSWRGSNDRRTDRRVYSLGWDNDAKQYALTQATEKGDTSLVGLFKTVEEAQRHIAASGDNFKAIAGDRKAELTFQETTKSLEVFDDRIKRLGQTTTEVMRVMSSINKQFTTSGVAVGVGAYGSTAASRLTGPMAGAMNQMYEAQQQYNESMGQAALARRNLQSSIMKRRRKGDTRSDEEIIRDAREDARAAKQNQAGAADYVSLEISEADQALNGYLDSARRALDVTRQTAEALREAVENIKSLQDSSLELYNVWSEVGQAVKASRDAAWAMYEVQKTMAADAMASSMSASIGLGGSQHEAALALDRKYEEASSRAISQIAGAYVGGMAANARAFGGEMPMGIRLPSFAQGGPSAYSLLENQLYASSDLAGSGAYSGAPENVLNEAAMTFYRAVGIFAGAVGAPGGSTEGADTSKGRIFGAGLAEGGFSDRIVAQSPHKSKDSFLAWLNKGEYVLPAGMAAVLGPALEQGRTKGGTGALLGLLSGIRGYAEGGYVSPDEETARRFIQRGQRYGSAAGEIPFGSAALRRSPDLLLRIAEQLNTEPGLLRDGFDPTAGSSSRALADLNWLLRKGGAFGPQYTDVIRQRLADAGLPAASNATRFSRLAEQAQAAGRYHSWPATTLRRVGPAWDSFLGTIGRGEEAFMSAYERSSAALGRGFNRMVGGIGAGMDRTSQFIMGNEAGDLFPRLGRGFNRLTSRPMAWGQRAADWMFETEGGFRPAMAGIGRLRAGASGRLDRLSQFIMGNEAGDLFPSMGRGFNRLTERPMAWGDQALDWFTNTSGGFDPAWAAARRLGGGISRFAGNALDRTSQFIMGNEAGDLFPRLGRGFNNMMRRPGQWGNSALNWFVENEGGFRPLASGARRLGRGISNAAYRFPEFIMGNEAGDLFPRLGRGFNNMMRRPGQWGDRALNWFHETEGGFRPLATGVRRGYDSLRGAWMRRGGLPAALQEPVGIGSTEPAIARPAIAPEAPAPVLRRPRRPASMMPPSTMPASARGMGGSEFGAMVAEQRRRYRSQFTLTPEPAAPTLPPVGSRAYYQTARQYGTGYRGLAGRPLLDNEIGYLQRLPGRLQGMSREEARGLYDSGSQAFFERTGRAPATSSERRIGMMWHEQNQAAARGGYGRPAGTSTGVVPDLADNVEATPSPRPGDGPTPQRRVGASADDAVRPATTPRAPRIPRAPAARIGVASRLLGAVEPITTGLYASGRYMDERGVANMSGLEMTAVTAGAPAAMLGMTALVRRVAPAAGRALAPIGRGIAGVASRVPGVSGVVGRVAPWATKAAPALGRWAGPVGSVVTGGIVGYADTGAIHEAYDRGATTTGAQALEGFGAAYGGRTVAGWLEKYAGMDHKRAGRWGRNIGIGIGVGGTIAGGLLAGPGGALAVAGYGLGTAGGRALRFATDQSTHHGRFTYQKPSGSSAPVEQADSAPLSYLPQVQRTTGVRQISRDFANTLLAQQRQMGQEIQKNLAASLTEFRRESPNMLGQVYKGRMRGLLPTEFSGLGPLGTAWGMSDNPLTGVGSIARMGVTEGIINRLGYGGSFGRGGGVVAQEQAQAAEGAWRSKMDAAVQQFGDWSSSQDPRVRALGTSMMKAAANLDKFGTGEWEKVLQEIPAELRGSANTWARNMKLAAEQVAIFKDRSEILGTHQKVAESAAKLVGGVGPTGRQEVGRVQADAAANMLLNGLAPGRVRSPFEMQREAAQAAEQQFRSGAADIYQQTIRGRTPQDRANAQGAWSALQALQSGDTKTYNNLLGGLSTESRSVVTGLAKLAQTANWQPPRRGEVEEQMLTAAYGASSEFLNYALKPEQYSYLMGQGMDMSPVVMGPGAARGGREQYAVNMDYMRQWSPGTADMWGGFSGQYTMSDVWGRSTPHAEMGQSNTVAKLTAKIDTLAQALSEATQVQTQAATQQTEAAQRQVENAQMFGGHVARLNDGVEAAASHGRAAAQAAMSGSGRHIPPSQIQGGSIAASIAAKAELGAEVIRRIH